MNPWPCPANAIWTIFIASVIALAISDSDKCANTPRGLGNENEFMGRLFIYSGVGALNYHGRPSWCGCRRRRGCLSSEAKSVCRLGDGGALIAVGEELRCAAISPISQSALTSYILVMAGERDAQFASDLVRMSDAEVRQHVEPSEQPVPILRTMAVTELERRRQKRTDSLSRPSFRLGKVAVGTVMLGAIIAAIGVWATLMGYVG